MTGRPMARLVHDDGQLFAHGDRVRLERTGSTLQELHAIKDPDGPFEVLTWTPVPFVQKRLMQLMLREVDST